MLLPQSVEGQCPEAAQITGITEITVAKLLHPADKFCLKQAGFELKDKPLLSNRSCRGRVEVFSLLVSFPHRDPPLCRRTTQEVYSGTLSRHTQTHRQSHSHPPPLDAATLPESSRNKTLHGQNFWWSSGAFMSRTRVIKQQFPMCAWVPTPNRPGLHITTTDHNHPHMAGAIGRDISSLISLSLFFSFEFSSFRVITPSRTAIYPFLFFSSYGFNGAVHCYISYSMLFCFNPPQRIC